MTDAPSILRRSIQTYVDQHTLFLPMPLSYSCMDKDCSTAGAGGADFACKGNTCVDSTTDQTTLPDFDPTLLDGTGLCFSPAQCFPAGATFPAATIDATSCIYGLPSYVTESALTSGVNVKVQIVKNAGELEILNLDPPNCGDKGAPACEGFKVLGPASDAGISEAASHVEASVFPGDSGVPALAYNPSALRIQLAPGLCELVQAGLTPPKAPPTGQTSTYHTISDISMSGLCQPKLPLLPICAGERNNNPVLPDSGTTGDGVCNVAVPLTPAPSVLYLVMDDTAVMHGALGPTGSVTTLSLSFSDPVFKRMYSGFKFVTANDQECTSQTTGYTVPAVPGCTPPQTCTFSLINSIQAQVAGQLSGWGPPPGEVVAQTDGGAVVCYADVDCVNGGQGTYCSKPNAQVPEGGAPDAGDDGGGDAGLTPGVCVNPQSLDLQAAMRLDVGAYAQVSQVASTLPTAAVAGVMFFVNRVPETSTDAGTSDAGGIDGGGIDGGPSVDAGSSGSGIAAYPPPIGAQDCPMAPPTGANSSAMTPGDIATVPTEALNAQQVIESEALNAFSNPGQSMQTYFVVLDNDRHDHTALNFFNQVQADLVQPSGALPVITLDTLDVSKSALTSTVPGEAQRAKDELTAFTQIITKLGTCLYEVPQTVSASSPLSSVLVQYSQPLPPGSPPPPPGSNPPVTIPADPTCNQGAVLAAGDSGTGPNGWNFDTGRIRICGASCENLRTLVQNLGELAIATGTTALDVPVVVTPLCSGSGGSDATTGGD
jgi:hypothetical protein